MKFIILYSANEASVPHEDELRQALQCNHVAKLGGSDNSHNQRSKWAEQHDSGNLFNFGVGVFRNRKVAVKTIWGIDIPDEVKKDKSAIYIVSDDAKRNAVEWYALKTSFFIKLFLISKNEFNLALKLIIQSSEVRRACQYEIARTSRQQFLKNNFGLLNSLESAFLEELSSVEEEIQMEYEKISERLLNEAKNLLTKDWED